MPQPPSEIARGPPTTNGVLSSRCQEASLDSILQALVDCRTELRLDIRSVSESLNLLLEQRCEQRKASTSADHASLHKSKSVQLDDHHKFRRVLTQAWQNDHASHRASALAKQATKVEWDQCEQNAELEPENEVAQEENQSKVEIDHNELWGSVASNLHQHFVRKGFTTVMRKKTSFLMNLSHRFVTSLNFEIVMLGFVLLNILSLCVQVQMQGLYVYEQVGLDVSQAAGSAWTHWKSFFEISEYIFTTIYFFELLLRIHAHGRDLFKNLFDIIDACVILINCVECVYLAREQDRRGALKLAVLRVFRLLRIVRFAELAHYMTDHFKDVELFMRTLFHSFHSLVWCVIIVAIVISAAAVFLAQICMDLLDDETIEPEQRRWLFDSFGTTDRALYTLFECTFTSHWWHFARVTIEEVRVAYVWFWIPFVIIVNFAMIRVISALFLRQALSLAEVDKERAAMEQLSKKELFAKEIKGIFAEADLSNDGLLSKEEWDKMLHNPKVLSHFHEMDMEVIEVDAVFRICSSDDEVVDFDEFLHSALKLKGSARMIDVIQIMHQQLIMCRQMADISRALSQWC